MLPQKCYIYKTRQRLVTMEYHKQKTVLIVSTTLRTFASGIQYIPMNLYKTLLLSLLTVPVSAQQTEQTLTYRTETAVTVSNGDYTPL